MISKTKAYYESILRAIGHNSLMPQKNENQKNK